MNIYPPIPHSEQVPAAVQEGDPAIAGLKMLLGANGSASRLPDASSHFDELAGHHSPAHDVLDVQERRAAMNSGVGTLIEGGGHGTGADVAAHGAHVLAHTRLNG